MSGLNRAVAIAGLMSALSQSGAAVVGAGRAMQMFAIRAKAAEPLMNFKPTGYPRGKGRNKSPRRHSGVRAAKRAAIKARNRRRS